MDPPLLIRFLGLGTGALLLGMAKSIYCTSCKNLTVILAMAGDV